MSIIGVYPGTFDPITLGHIDIMKRAAIMVDKLIIGVAKDVAKSTLFNAEERAEMVKHEIKAFGIQAEVHIFNGLLIYFAQQQSASMIIRGLRAVSDFDYEFQMSWVNYKLSSDINTVFLPASEDTQFISSSFVKEIAKLNGDISVFVSEYVCDKLKEKNKNSLLK
mgnify:CR=1 FL=1